jgi:hypothetical protein
MQGKSWVTTLFGIVTLIATISKAIADLMATGAIQDATITVTGLAVGSGLIAAKDFNKN